MRNPPDLQSLYSHVLSPIPIEDQRQISGILCMFCLGSFSNTRWRQQERGTMKTEISTAAAFVTKLLKTSGLIEETQLQQFCHSLQDSMRDHYKHHWFPQLPCKGSGYRCLRINHKMDPLIGRAAGHIGLSHRRLFQLLPSELTLWVDPFEVSYRIGEDGSICVLYEGVPAATMSLEAHSSCKDTLRMGRDSPTKNYNMMTVSS